MLRGGEVKDKLESYEIDECKQKVDNYIKTEDPSANIILNDRLKINECFYYFKTLYNS
jgi:kinesin family member 6/9